MNHRSYQIVMNAAATNEMVADQEVQESKVDRKPNDEWMVFFRKCFLNIPWIGNRSSTFGSINEATCIGQDSNPEVWIFLGL